MTRQSRVDILRQMERAGNFRALAYVTGARRGLEAQVAFDQLPLFRRHLVEIGEVDQIALVVHTNGGDTNVPWPLMNQIREHCKSVTVMVPSAALSAGTLLTLGADRIVMTKFASLSPIDPTVANAFNPQDPTNPAARLPIAVEDVLSFLELAEQSGPGQEQKNEAFRQLAASVHPLALGNVQRSINQIRKLARQMLGLTSAERTDEQVAALVKSLTTEFYSHMHLIGRREATALGLPISADTQIEALLDGYYNRLAEDMQLFEPFDAPAVVRSAQATGQPIPVDVQYERGFIETTDTCDAYVTRGKIAQQLMPAQQLPFPGSPIPQMQQIQQIPQQAVTFEITGDRWEPVTDGQPSAEPEDTPNRAKTGQGEAE